MKDILAELQKNGWAILREEESRIWANRKSTGKKSFFINQQDLSGLREIDLLRLWSDKEFHPFIYQEVKGGYRFFDFLFNEEVKSP